MANEWHYSLFGECFGPVGEADLCRLIQSGTLGAEDEITSANGDTVRLGEHAFFARLFEDSDLEYATDLDEFSLEDEAPSENKAAVQSSQTVAAPTQVVVASSTNTAVSKVRSKPAEEPPRREKQADSSSKPAAPRRKRKVRREPHDPLLMEIFAELDARKQPEPASSTGSRSDISARVPSSTSAATSVQTSSSSMSTSMSATSRQLSSTTVESTVPRAATQSYSSSSSASANAWKPSKKSTSPSFTMPEPRTLGIAGGVVVAIGLVGSFLMGWISLPGGSGGELTGASGAVVSCYLEFQSLGGVPEKQEWAGFQSSVKTRLTPVLESGDADDVVREAGKLLAEVASCDPRKDADKLRAAAEKLGPLVSKITGS